MCDYWSGTSVKGTRLSPVAVRGDPALPPGRTANRTVPARGTKRWIYNKPQSGQMLFRHLPTLKHPIIPLDYRKVLAESGHRHGAVKTRSIGLSGNAFLDHREPLGYSFLASLLQKREIRIPPTQSLPEAMMEDDPRDYPSGFQSAVNPTGTSQNFTGTFDSDLSCCVFPVQRAASAPS